MKKIIKCYHKLKSKYKIRYVGYWYSFALSWWVFFWTDLPWCIESLCSTCAMELSQQYRTPCSSTVPHPLPSPLLRQYIISCLLNTWRQSQRGNYWGHSHVCTQPSLTHRTSFRTEKRPCCYKGRRRGSDVDWWSAPDLSNMIQQMSLSPELIKPGICCCFFIRHWTWRCARTKDEGGLSPTLNHKDAGIHERGTHTNTQPAMTCLLPKPQKTGKDFEVSRSQKSLLLRNLINNCRDRL